METSFISFALALLIFNSFALSSSATFFNFTTDQQALLAFKNTITSHPNGILANWSINTSICFWKGVSCSAKPHRVVALNVSDFELGGTITPHLGNLTFLRSLDISFNNFTGSIPSELSNLRRLNEINVGVNSFTGEVPSWLGALHELQHIHLNNNNFSGRIPFSLFNVSKLQTLDIGYNLLEGNIPGEIGNFTYLETVNLADNQFTGSIPNGMFNISSLIEISVRHNMLSGKLPNDICSNISPKLKRINLSTNELYGEIPANIYKCGVLEELRLSKNHFNGSIPSEIGSLTMLRVLSMVTNNFTGHIPKQFGNLTSLQGLDLAYNKLTGDLPQELGNLAYLEIFAVPFNDYLSGSIPSSIFNISTLKKVALQQNQFSGSLPSNMGLSLFNLEELYLFFNKLNGEIPSSITNASKLTVLELNRNSFSGSIPNFGNLEHLKVLRLWENYLTGAESPTQELGFISSLTNCQYLESLEISDNPLNGVLPASIGNLSTSLVSFWAVSCNIKGGIPSEIGNLTSLQTLLLSENQLTGPIPTTIGKLKQLYGIYLDGNQLQGYIPRDLCQLSKLGELQLSQNMLTGPIHECFGELKSLRNVVFASNMLNSTIPSKFWDLTDLVALDLSSNYLSGRLLSSRIGSWNTIYVLDLSSNQITGDIPSSIDDCQSLEFLFLSNNKFRGSIPESLGKVRGLRMLDLSNNNLSGLIPKSLEDLHVLEDFNVSYNKLKGEIPNGGRFDSFTAQSFGHNYALCGARRFQVPPCVKNHGGLGPKGIALLIMKYIVPPFILVIILVVVMLMLIRRRKQIKMPLLADTSLGRAYRRISYIELVRGTSSFSEANLLGRGSFGSVFKATLSDGLNVAVKVFNLHLEGAIKSFDIESEILSTIRHRNLVRIIGCCTNTEFRALILEYMPNGSLEKWLHSDNYFLDLVQRLKIATDVALALEYLHHGHIFPIVHCDIKPKNVLLDEDMTAYVGDFGIAKLFDEGQVEVQTKTLATIGYVAPGMPLSYAVKIYSYKLILYNDEHVIQLEYGSDGKVSTNGDVYSYGIMLLEMFTRKKPTDDMFNGELSLKEWVSEALRENAIREVVAPGLLSSEDQHFFVNEQCVASIFDLAMKCLTISPNERINMIEVAATLQKIKSTVATGTRRR